MRRLRRLDAEAQRRSGRKGRCADGERAEKKMRRIVRGFLWLIKAMLLAIALAALVLWPWSYGYRGQREIRLSQLTPRPERVAEVWFVVEWSYGRVSTGGWQSESAGMNLNHERGRAAAHGAGWHWEFNVSGAFFGAFDHSWGPFRWNVVTLEHYGDWCCGHNASLPCWLLASLTGAWPLTSLALLRRRRARTRRRARAGCCRQCGYDLRATPLPGVAGGELLSLCPECGTAQR